jgi:hypothetical protein
MAHTHSFDPSLQPWLTARAPRLADYSQQLADFRHWVYSEVDPQANYTDRYAPPALETYDRDGEVVNHIVVNRWYDEQHQEIYRRGIVGLPYAEKAPHLLTFAMGYLLAQADISLHCPVTLTGAVAYVLSAHAPECGSGFCMTWCAWMDSPRPAAPGQPSRTAAATWEQPPRWPSPWETTTCCEA